MSEASAGGGGADIARPGDRRPQKTVRRPWNAMAVAALPPGADPSARPACDRASRRACERDLLLSVVLEHEPRRRLRALDAERAHAAPGRRVPVLPAARRVLERRPAD